MLNLMKKLGIYSLSFLAAAGNALQNYIASVALIASLVDASFAATKVGLGLIHSVAALLGGLCSGLVNMCINVELLESFVERITKKKRPKLKGWEKFRYWFGSGVFIGTGILFGLTTFAFGSMGVLTAISIAAGIFVAAVMVIQELETWLESFDNKKDGKKKSLMEIFREWKNSLTPGKLIGNLIALGNVVALSLLFTLGLATFFTGVGVPALPALIVSFVVAFTGGAFTEFYFYNSFLGAFCDKFKEKWQQFKQAAYPVLGFVIAGLNGIVNGVLSYVGIMMLPALLVAAGVAVPPLGAMIAIAVVASTIAAAASFILGVDFWQRNSSKLVKLTNFFKNKFSPAKPDAGMATAHNTESLLTRLHQSETKPASAKSTTPKQAQSAKHDTKITGNGIKLFAVKRKPAGFAHKSSIDLSAQSSVRYA